MVESGLALGGIELDRHTFSLLRKVAIVHVFVVTENGGDSVLAGAPP
jgi:hypothetical protein